MEIAQQYGGLGASDDQDQEHKEQKAEHVVHRIRPDRIEDKEELDKNAAEGQHAAHYDARDGLRVNGLIGDLSRNLIGAHGMFKSLDMR